MSTGGWKECRRRRTFPWPVAWTQTGYPKKRKRGVFGKFDPLMERFLEYETMVASHHLDTCSWKVWRKSIQGKWIHAGSTHLRSGAWFTWQKTLLRKGRRERKERGNKRKKKEGKDGRGKKDRGGGRSSPHSPAVISKSRLLWLDHLEDFLRATVNTNGWKRHNCAQTVDNILTWLKSRF